MSGGVDSSVAAALLVERGFEVIGVTMRVWPWKESDDPARRFGSCCGSEAVDDARRVARELGIPYYVLNMEAEFDRAVIGPFAKSAAFEAALAVRTMARLSSRSCRSQKFNPVGFAR